MVSVVVCVGARGTAVETGVDVVRGTAIETGVDVVRGTAIETEVLVLQVDKRKC